MAQNLHFERSNYFQTYLYIYEYVIMWIFIAICLNIYVFEKRKKSKMKDVTHRENIIHCIYCTRH